MKEKVEPKFTFASASIDALAHHELEKQVGFHIDYAILEQVYALHVQPAKIKIISSEIHPSLLPYVQLNTTQFESYVYLRIHAKNTIKNLKEKTSCTFGDFTYLVNGIYFGKPSELYGIWTGSTQSPQLKNPKSNIGKKVAHVGFTNGAHELIEF